MKPFIHILFLLAYLFSLSTVSVSPKVAVGNDITMHDLGALNAIKTQHGESSWQYQLANTSTELLDYYALAHGGYSILKGVYNKVVAFQNARSQATANIDEAFTETQKAKISKAEELAGEILGGNGVSGAGRFIANSSTELKTYLDNLVNLPVGKPYSGKIYKSINKSAELTHNAKPNIISEYSIEEAWGRYDLQGESGMYYSKTFQGNQTEMSAYGDWNSYSTYEFNNVQINNMLDLTDPYTIGQLGTEFNKLILTTGTKPEMYEFTNVIGTWARFKGYKGLIVPGARGNQDYINIVIFKQSDITNTLRGITPIKLK